MISVNCCSEEALDVLSTRIRVAGLLSRVREISGSCLSPETGYSDRIFVVFIISMLFSTSFRNSYPLLIASFDAGPVSTTLNKLPISYIKAIFVGKSTE
jgi:hypothetical protein